MRPISDPSLLQVQTISGLIAAVCIMQFTYTFPPLFLLVFLIKRDAAAAGGRWTSGLLGKHWYFKAFNLVLFLGGLSAACLGMYGSGTAIKTTFATSQATSFGCTAPV